jgi:hypothetical protein
MIERHAPRYAAFLNSIEYPPETFYGRPDGEIHVLHGFQRAGEMLDTFSVYRLDWLEEIGVTPKGNVFQLTENIFFSDAAFTMDEFISIMAGFTRPGRRHGLVFSIGWEISIGFEPLRGMFGLNNTNILENGSAVYAAASEAFHSYLSFMENLRDKGLIQYTGYSFNDDVGWTSIKYDGSSVRHGHISYLPIYEGSKYLLTPPEIGPGGRQGVGYDGQPGALKVIANYLIRADVSDAKLAKILEIFDAVSFDPELYVLTRYGFEGEDFTWRGEPYNSYAEQNPESVEYYGLFNTKTVDGFAGKHIYNYPSAELYR